MFLENKNLLNAEIALSQATSENIIELCRVYLGLLDEYRDELYKFRGAPEIDLRQAAPAARESIEQTRRSIRAAVESITERRNQTESLLRSFTAINGADVVKTFNQLEYKGFIGWELRSNRIRLESSGEQLTVQEAVEIAGLLRRRAYLADKTTF
jgi:hypothetical protein